jgi:hypothetical protein
VILVRVGNSTFKNNFILLDNLGEFFWPLKPSPSLSHRRGESSKHFSLFTFSFSLTYATLLLSIQLYLARVNSQTLENVKFSATYYITQINKKLKIHIIMSIKTRLEAIYCSLPRPIIEALAPKSSLYEIQQGQKYSQTEFRNPETGKSLNYCEMLELHKTKLLADYRKSISTNYHLFMAVSDSFEIFVERFIQIEKGTDEQSIQYEAGSVEALMEGMQRLKSTLSEYGIDLTKSEDQATHNQDPLDNSPYDPDIFYN